VLESATSGRMSALQAARLNVARAGSNLTLLDGLHAQQSGTFLSVPAAVAEITRDGEQEEVAAGAGPFSHRRQRISS
jgi:hypothetical protein